MPVRASDRVTLAVLPAISYTRTYYLLQASALAPPAKPTTNPPAAPWSTTEPNYTSGSTNTLYTTQLVVYGTVAFEYGDVQKASAYEAAKQAYNLAASTASTVDGMRRVRVGASQPATPPAGWVNGDQWWVTNTAGTEITDIRVWNGTTFVPLKMVASSLLVPSSVGNVLIADGAVDGKTITGATVQTESTVNRGVKLDSNGIRSYDTAGVQVFSLDKWGGASFAGYVATAVTGEPRWALTDNVMRGYADPDADPTTTLSHYAAGFDITRWQAYAGSQSTTDIGSIELDGATGADASVVLRAGPQGADARAEVILTPDELRVRRSGAESPWSVRPAGEVTQFAGATAPTGWLICDGGQYSRTTYARLFAVIGTTYGTGNGSTTFNLPNMKGRVPVGRDTAQTEFDTLGETGGAKTVALTPQQNTLTLGIGTGRLLDAANASAAPGQVGMNEKSVADQAHQNMPPYIVLNYIIKT